MIEETYSIANDNTRFSIIRPSNSSPIFSATTVVLNNIFSRNLSKILHMHFFHPPHVSPEVCWTKGTTLRSHFFVIFSVFITPYFVTCYYLLSKMFVCCRNGIWGVTCALKGATIMSSGIWYLILRALTYVYLYVYVCTFRPVCLCI